MHQLLRLIIYIGRHAHTDGIRLQKDKTTDEREKNKREEFSKKIVFLLFFYFLSADKSVCILVWNGSLFRRKLFKFGIHGFFIIHSLWIYITLSWLKKFTASRYSQ